MVARWLVGALLLAACGGTPPPAAAVSPHKPGPLADTWFDNGSTWRQLPGLGPSPRYAASLAYDAARSNFVLFGGQSGATSHNETWTFDGKNWNRRTPAHNPPARREAAMAYDPIRKLVVLYGGLIADAAEGREGADTWTWNGADWTAVAPESNGAPGHREGARMVSTADGVILFGGRIGNVTYFDDAWGWDGTKWSRNDSTPRPPGRAYAAVAWDPLHRSLVVYGGTGFNPAAGIGAQGTPLGDTWVLAGVSWRNPKPPGPPALSFATAIWDRASSHVLLLFGMDCPRPTSDSWAWDGVGWSRVATGKVPPRWGAAVAQDGNGNTLAFGGSDEAGC